MKNIIGQQNLRNKILKLIEDNKLPRCMILVGSKGSGKKLIADWIVFVKGVYRVLAPDCKIDTVRDIIEQAYKISDPTIYIIPSVDKMSVAAKNSLLKITEDIPNNAYFILTAENIDNVLPTLRSRASVYYMDYYTPDDILNYCVSIKATNRRDELDIIRKLCEVPGDVDELLAVNILEFYSYVTLVFENIATVSGSNAFKIGDRIAFKEDSDGYNLRLFLLAFRSVCANAFRSETTDLIKYVDGVKITSKYINELSIPGVSKRMLFDSWLLEIRSAWM